MIARAPGTNEFLWSEDFTKGTVSRGFWIGVGMPSAPAGIASPFGVAHLFNEGTANSQHGFIHLNHTGDHMSWALVKAADVNNPRGFQISASSPADMFVNFDLIAGSVAKIGAGLNPANVQIIDEGNGWFSVGAKFNSGGHVYMHITDAPATAVRFQGYQGIAGNGVYVSAVQREAIGVAEIMGYVKTTNAPVV